MINWFSFCKLIFFVEETEKEFSYEARFPFLALFLPFSQLFAFTTCTSEFFKLMNFHLFSPKFPYQKDVMHFFDNFLNELLRSWLQFVALKSTFECKKLLNIYAKLERDWGSFLRFYRDRFTREKKGNWMSAQWVPFFYTRRRYGKFSLHVCAAASFQALVSENCACSRVHVHFRPKGNLFWSNDINKSIYYKFFTSFLRNYLQPQGYERKEEEEINPFFVITYKHGFLYAHKYLTCVCI